MKLVDLVTTQSIVRDIRTGTKPEVLAELAGRAAYLTSLDRMVIFRALLEHEAQASSGLGLGVAMLHARFASLIQPVALFARLSHPVEFHALDKRPVDILFLLLGPEPATATYLKLLLAASRTLRNPGIRQSLRENFDVPSVSQALRESAFLDAP